MISTRSMRSPFHTESKNWFAKRSPRMFSTIDIPRK